MMFNSEQFPDLILNKKYSDSFLFQPITLHIVSFLHRNLIMLFSCLCFFSGDHSPRDNSTSSFLPSWSLPCVSHLSLSFAHSLALSLFFRTSLGLCLVKVISLSLSLLEPHLSQAQPFAAYYFLLCSWIFFFTFLSLFGVHFPLRVSVIPSLMTQLKNTFNEIIPDTKLSKRLPFPLCAYGALLAEQT